MTNYHQPESCNKCQGKNEVDWTSTIEGHLCEAKTKCGDCGHSDYWAYGFFESGQEMVSNCKTYTNTIPLTYVTRIL